MELRGDVSLLPCDGVAELLPVVALAAGGHAGALEAPEAMAARGDLPGDGDRSGIRHFFLSWTKLPHYTLPAFPFMALLLAAWWESGRDCQYRWAGADGDGVAAMVAAWCVPPGAAALRLPTAL